MVIYYSYQKERKINKCNKLVRNFYDKNNYVDHKIIETSIKSWTNTKESS